MTLARPEIGLPKRHPVEINDRSGSDTDRQVLGVEINAAMLNHGAGPAADIEWCSYMAWFAEVEDLDMITNGEPGYLRDLLLRHRT